MEVAGWVSALGGTRHPGFVDGDARLRPPTWTQPECLRCAQNKRRGTPRYPRHFL